MDTLPQSPDFKAGRKAGFDAGYESATAFYRRRGDHAATAATTWRALGETDRGKNTRKVLTQIHPQLVQILDQLAEHELGAHQG